MIGQPIPNVVLKTRVRDESIGGDNPFRWQDAATGDIFSQGRHILFALPGARPLAPPSNAQLSSANTMPSKLPVPTKCIAYRSTMPSSCTNGASI